MIALRLLSLLASFLVLFLPTVLMADPSVADLSGRTVIAGLAGMGLVSASFVYIGVAGDRMRRNPLERVLGAVLLAVPIAGSLALLVSRKESGVLWGSGILLVFSLMLFLGFVFPAGERRQRPMRRRERQDPGLLKLQG